MQHVTVSITQNVVSIIADVIAQQFFDKNHVIVAIGGPGGVGKTTFAKELAATLCDETVIGLDAYKKPKTQYERKGLEGPNPEANYMDLVTDHLKKIQQGVNYDKRIRDWGSSKVDIAKTQPSKYNLVDGEISTYADFRAFIDFSIFIDASEETQLHTRLTRDITRGGISESQARKRFYESNIVQFGKFGRPSKNWCDLHLFCESNYSLRIVGVSKDIFEKYRVLFTN